MRHPDAIYRPEDSRVRDRDLSEFTYRLPPALVLASLLVLSLGLWAAIWALLRIVSSLVT